MKAVPAKFQKYLFVCENERTEGACCMPEGRALREALKSAVKEAGLSSKIRVSRAGCLDVCAEGPNILLMPDHRWYQRVTAADLPVILDDAKRGIAE